VPTLSVTFLPTNVKIHSCASKLLQAEGGTFFETRCIYISRCYACMTACNNDKVTTSPLLLTCYLCFQCPEPAVRNVRAERTSGGETH